MEKLLQTIKADIRRQRNVIGARDFDESHKLIIKTIAEEMIPGYEFDESNKSIYELLLKYFNGDSSFETKGYSLRKGILLVGPIGTGKTSIMKIFQKYCYYTKSSNEFLIASARIIERDFLADGYPGIDKYGFNLNEEICSYDDPKYTREKTYCFDDSGLENYSVKHYGTETSPLNDILLDRYDIFSDKGIVTHMTTNLDPDGMLERYGNRLYSRFVEMFNIIVVPGKDRRQ